MTGELQGLVVVVTGASSGIGEAVALSLAAEGAEVALLARRGDRLDELVRKIGSATGGRAHAYPVDVTDAESVAAVVDRVATDLEGIAVLVNSAGYGMWGPAVDADLADWRRMVDVNIMGVLAVTRLALPHLIAAAAGRRGVADVVTVSSVAGRKVPASASNVYGATKHAVGAFSEALRQEMAPHHVRVGLVEPGVVVTELTTKGGNNAPDATVASEFTALRAEDVADAISYMVTRPRHMAVNELLVRPVEQLV